MRQAVWSTTRTRSVLAGASPCHHIHPAACLQRRAPARSQRIQEENQGAIRVGTVSLLQRRQVDYQAGKQTGLEALVERCFYLVTVSTIHQFVFLQDALLQINNPITRE